jgi:hypothetical protein
VIDFRSVYKSLSQVTDMGLMTCGIVDHCITKFEKRMNYTPAALCTGDCILPLQCAMTTVSLHQQTCTGSYSRIIHQTSCMSPDS